MTAPGELEAQVQNMPRGQVMQQVAGPLLTRLLRPIYTPLFKPVEEAQIPHISDFDSANNFTLSLMQLLGRRLHDAEVYQHPDYQTLDAMTTNRQHPLFAFSKTKVVIDESIASGVVIPMTLAAQIHRVESGDAGFFAWQARYLEFSAPAAAAIIRRPAFYKMLQRLTRGPNGFLGGGATHPQLESKYLFDFRQNREFLDIDKAFSINESGEVDDFSNLYYIAAAAKRPLLKRSHAATSNLPPPNGRSMGYYYATSSGCPVRHRFDVSGGHDAETQKEESLIATAQTFLVAALDKSAHTRTVERGINA